MRGANATVVGFDPIGVLERAYQPFEDGRAWLDAVAPEITRPFDAEHRGTISYFIDPSELRPQRIRFEQREGGAPGTEQAIGSLLTGLAHAGSERLERFARGLRGAGAFSLAETIGSTVEPAMTRLGLKSGDSPAVVIPTGEGLTAVAATFTEQRASIARDERALWRRIAIHLGAACRIASRPRAADGPDVEAVLAPDGRLLDARAPAARSAARATLRDGVRRMDRARTRRYRRAPFEALELWGALLAGRWSLVENIDTDGRRFVLARRNDPDPGQPAALTRRQRQVLCYASVGWSLKQIGYALGIAEGSVTYHLRRGLAQTGIGSRIELVRATSDAAVRALRAIFATADESAERLDALTGAERLVVERVVAGETNEAIAAARGVSASTIANQLTAIYRKLDVRDRVELVERAAPRSRS